MKTHRSILALAIVATAGLLLAAPAQARDRRYYYNNYDNCDYGYSRPRVVYYRPVCEPVPYYRPVVYAAPPRPFFQFSWGFGGNRYCR